MKKNYYSLLAVSILTAMYSSESLADLKQQCLLGVPQFSGELINGDLNNQPVYIEADAAVINQPKDATYTGGVDIKQANRHLKAERVRVEQIGTEQNPQRYAYAQGGFDYKDEYINLLGADAKIHLNSKDADALGIAYQLVNRQGRGTADSAELRNNYRLMKNATFTSCLQNDNSWSIKASEMRQDLDEEIAEMWHARFQVMGVPVFYTPYLQLPLGDRRRSGLLIPQIGSSSRDGFFYAQPIYWNIAPNYDATITPKYMTSRGWQLISEGRYLTHYGEGKVAGEYMQKDRYSDYVGENKKRYLINWQNNSRFLGDWRLNVDYTKVSDKRYFSDFDSDYGSSTDGYATQTAKISYYKPNYNFSIAAKQFQIFDEVDIGPYRALPQIDFNYYKNDLANGLLDFKLFSQAVHFDNDSNLMPTAWRFHVEPSLELPLASKYGSMNIETKLYATHYQQKKGSGDKADEVQKSVNRVLPQFKIDLQTTLANKDSFIDGYKQTLEPHIQYLYRPYKNQSNIGSKRNSEYLGLGYDSSLLQQDYFALFRDRRYSGLDRIASANQVTVGGTTRLFDNLADERFNLSLGQTYYLSDSKIDDTSQNSTTGRSSSWAVESDWKISDKWNWRGSYQYDTRLNETSLANTTLEYNPERNNLVQLNYRFASQNYIDQNLNRGVNRYNQDIKQIGLTTAWELTDNWAVIGRYYHDLALSKAVEQYAGVQYSSCCWSVGVGARRYLTSKANQSYSGEKDVFYDNSFNLNFELRGLGGRQHYNLDKLLSKGLLPYKKPFNL